MRIIPDGIDPHNHNIAGIGEYPHFDIADTIEITDKEIQDIFWAYYYEIVDNHTVTRFGEYLRKLIELKRTK